MNTFIRKTYKIEYSHRVFNQRATESNPDTKCRCFHGHSGRVTIELGCRKLNTEGMVIDFTDLKPIKKYFGLFDHAMILSRDDAIGRRNFGVDSGVTFDPARMFEFMADRIIIINSPYCSSEVIAWHWAKDVMFQLDTIYNELQMENGIFLRALEFSETDNNTVRIEV